MRRPAVRRFPQEVIRRRQGVGDYNQFGEFEPGPVVETPLPALIQPLEIQDSDFAGE